MTADKAQENSGDSVTTTNNDEVLKTKNTPDSDEQQRSTSKIGKPITGILPPKIQRADFSQRSEFRTAQDNSTVKNDISMHQGLYLNKTALSHNLLRNLHKIKTKQKVHENTQTSLEL